MATKKITLNELRSIVKQIIKEEMILKEDANTDLELKSVAKQIFSVLKKYGLKPTYEADGKQFQSKERATGYGATVHIGENGIMTVALYDRGILQSIRRAGFPNIKKNEVSSSSDDPYNNFNNPTLIKAAKILQNDIISTLGQDKFEFRSQSNTDKYGQYIMQIRKKGAEVNPNQRPNAPKPQAQQQPVSEGVKKITMSELRNMIKEEISKGKY